MHADSLIRSLPWALASLVIPITSATVTAEETDLTQTPNPENAGMHKSFAEQVGAGRGSVDIPDSSRFIIARDPARAIRRGRNLFQRKFRLAQGLGPRTNDGIGDIAADGSLGAGLADSCAACHGRPRGSAGFGGDVFTRPDSRDAPHLFGLGLQEMLADEITQQLRALRDDAVEQALATGPLVVDLVAKGVHYGTLAVDGAGNIDTSDVQGVDPDLRVRPFFAEGSTISMREFIVGAFNAEMGLESPDPDIAAAAAGDTVVTPSGMVLDGQLDSIEDAPVHGPLEDSDNDGVTDEIPPAVVDFMEFYLLNYFKPGRYQPTTQALLGRITFNQIGCNTCHRANFVIDDDRRIADVQTVYDPQQGVFNRMFATASTRFDQVDDGSGFPTLKPPQGGSFLVEDIFTDFKRHDLGPAFAERQFDGSINTEFMTEPLWGVASTAPYGHDGRSINLDEVIRRHGGEAQGARDAYTELWWFQREWVKAFLYTLVLFPPDDTASNLDPGDPTDPAYPQRGHGSIRLPELFNDPTDLE